MEFTKYEIRFAIVYFEERNEYKARPVLIYDGGEKCAFCDIYSITSQDKKYKYNYEIKKWKEAGLLQPSYIKLAEQKTIDKNLIKDKLGELQKEDIEGMEQMLIEYAEDKEKAIKKYNTNQAINKIQIPDEIKNNIKPTNENDGLSR